MKKKLVVIGSGFSGISAAAHAARNGFDVTVLEKNNTLGGRARSFTEHGFTFDMGPSWYWMPDVFDRFFESFGKKRSDYYELVKTNPAFTMVFGEKDTVHIPNSYEELRAVIEKLETGGAQRLDRFMKNAEKKYRIGMQNLVYKPGLSFSEFMNAHTLGGLFHLNVFSSFRSYVRRFFKHPHVIALMEFPVLFLGSTPQKTPALYSLMNYAGLKTGTFYPMGGFGKVIDAMVEVASEQGVTFYTSCEVQKIEIQNKTVTQVFARNKTLYADAVIASGDYHHMEQLLPKENRNYTEAYWQSRTFAPSCLLFYLGVNMKLDNLGHHTLFFDYDLDKHAHDIYTRPNWPNEPLFYVCRPSATDHSVAPAGNENLFVLMPVAPGLPDTEEVREKYFNLLLARLEKHTGKPIREKMVYKRSYCVNDFVSDYGAFKGNAYGLANTLKQTALLKPKIKSKHIKNLFFAGQLTVPGPGVPPAIISGEVSARVMARYIKKTNAYENVI